MGYGSRALQALNSFYSGELLNLDEVTAEVEIETFEEASKISAVSLDFFALITGASADEVNRTQLYKRIRLEFEMLLKCHHFYKDFRNDNQRN